MNAMPNPSPDSAVASIAQSQYGLITRRQALDTGLSEEAIRSRVRAGRFIEAARNVYRLAGAPISWEQELLAAMLSLGAGAVVSRRSAGVLHGLLPRRHIIELTIPHSRRSKGAPGWIVNRSKDLRAQDLVRIGPFMVTDPHRTMIDLAAVLTPDALDDALDVGHQKGIVRIPRLAFLIRNTNRQGRRGVGVLARLVEERRHGGRVMDSRLERWFLALLKEWRFPLPTPQHRLRLPSGKRIRIDFA